MMNIFRGKNSDGNTNLNNIWTTSHPKMNSYTYVAGEERTEKYVINDDWGDDTLSISNANGKPKIFFSVSANGGMGNDLYIDAENSVLNAGLNPFSDEVTTGILIENYFTRDGHIETITSGLNDFDDNLIDQLRSNVANWLTANNYADTNAVFEGGHADDVTAMLNLYTAPWLTRPDDGLMPV